MHSLEILVIGGRGFLGNALCSHLARHFPEMKIQVMGRALPDGLADTDNVRFQNLDLLDPTGSHPDPVHARNIIYLAGVKGRFEKNTPDWLTQQAINAPDFPNLFRTLNITGERLITLGSSEEYGMHEGNSPIPEYGVCLPQTSYGESKLRLYHNAREWAHDNKKESLHLRPFVIYGKDQDPEMFLGSLITTLKNNRDFKMTLGQQWRSFVAIEQVCEAIGKASRRAVWPDDCVNLSSDTYLQIIDVGRKAERLIGKGAIQAGAVPYRSFEVWHQRPNLERLNKLIPDLSKRDFEKDLEMLIAEHT